MKNLLLSVWRPCLGIWLAAALLGLAFNSVSPLGVRFKTAAAPPGELSLNRPGNSGSVATPYSNQVLSLRLERPSGARSSAADYQNETLGTAVLAPAGLGAEGSVMALPNLQGLTWPQAKALQASNLAVLVDARNRAAYDAGCIPGAVSLPPDAPAEEFERFRARYPANTPLVVYCGSSSCPLSLRLAQILIGQYGYTSVRHIPGGYVEYRIAEQIAANASAAPPARTNHSPD